MQNLYIYLWIYFIVLLGISFFIFLKEKKEDFLISWRDRNWWTVMASKFAWSIWIAWFITYSWYAYKYGLWMFMVVFGFILWYILFAFWVVPKVYKKARDNKFYTQWDLVFHNTKNILSKNITNHFSWIVQLTWLLVSIIGWAKIMSTLWIVSYELALLYTIITVLFYILLAWYKAVLVTDVFQSIIMIVLLSLISYNIVWSENIYELLTIETWKLTLASTIWFFLYWILSVLSLADRYQLIYAAKSEYEMKKWLFLTFIPVVFVAFFITLIWLFMFIKNTNLDADLVFLNAIQNYIPSNLLPFGIVLLFAWLMSSADTYIYTISSHFVLNKSSASNPIKKIRIFTILLLIFTWIISYFFRDIIWMTIIWAWLSLVMANPMIYIIKWWKNKNKFLYSFFLWFIWLIIWLLILWLEPSVALFVLTWWALGLMKK